MQAEYKFPLTLPPTGQWRPTPTQPAPTTPPLKPPAPSTPPTTSPGTTSVPRPRLSHWIEASGRPTSPRQPEGPRRRGDTRPPLAGPHQDTGSRAVEIRRLTGRGSSRLRNTEQGMGRFAHLDFVFECCFLLFIQTFVLIYG